MHLTRALAADLLSGNGPLPPNPQWAAPFLVEALADNYPIVRFFAANGLSRQSWIGVKPDYVASAAARSDSLAHIRQMILALCERQK
jgi:hypothetical protein